MGPSILPHLEIAARQDDPEVAARLKDVISKLNKAVPPPPPLGHYRVGNVRALHYDAKGTIYVAASSVLKGETELGPGLVFGKDDNFEFLAGEEFATGWSTPQANSGPLSIKPGLIWVGSRLLDTRQRKFVDQLPEGRFFWLHAVQQTGRIFTGARAPTQSLKPIMVYTPGAGDDRLVLNADTIPLASVAYASDSFCIASDGSVWTGDYSDQLIRFDASSGTRSRLSRFAAAGTSRRSSATFPARTVKCSSISGVRACSSAPTASPSRSRFRT
jgi:hypothetical protein